MMKKIEERAHELCNEIGSSSKILTKYLYPVILKALEEQDRDTRQVCATALIDDQIKKLNCLIENKDEIFKDA
jgi:hypothetical protein